MYSCIQFILFGSHIITEGKVEGTRNLFHSAGTSRSATQFQFRETGKGRRRSSRGEMHLGKGGTVARSFDRHGLNTGFRIIQLSLTFFREMAL